MPDSLPVDSECRFAQNAELTVALAARLWELLAAGVDANGSGSLILSGGSTPVPLYNVLRELPLPWSRLRICLSDERWVEINHKASNEGMLKRELFPEEAEISLVSMARSGESLEAEASRVNRQLGDLDSRWDVAILGMGTDGHTASLFPDTEGLAQALITDASCVPMSPPGASESRLSLTLNELLKSRRIVLLLRGDEKWKVYQQALAGDDVEAMPVRAILQQTRVPVDVYWAAD